MGVEPEIQAEANSLVHQFLLNVDKSLAQEFLKKTKAVSIILAIPKTTCGITRVGFYCGNIMISVGLCSFNTKAPCTAKPADI